jgi:uncharacterized membrane protein
MDHSAHGNTTVRHFVLLFFDVIHASGLSSMLLLLTVDLQHATAHSPALYSPVGVGIFS